LDIHVRTIIEPVTELFSVVSAATIKVGDSVLEFNHETLGLPKFYVDQVEMAVSELPFANDVFGVSSRVEHNDQMNVDVTFFDIE